MRRIGIILLFVLALGTVARGQSDKALSSKKLLASCEQAVRDHDQQAQKDSRPKDDFDTGFCYGSVRAGYETTLVDLGSLNYYCLIDDFDDTPALVRAFVKWGKANPELIAESASGLPLFLAFRDTFCAFAGPGHVEPAEQLKGFHALIEDSFPAYTEEGEYRMLILRRRGSTDLRKLLDDREVVYLPQGVVVQVVRQVGSLALIADPHDATLRFWIPTANLDPVESE